MWCFNVFDILWHTAHYMTPVRWPLSEVQALRGFDRYDVAERCKELMRRLPGVPNYSCRTAQCMKREADAYFGHFWTVRHCPLQNLWERASTVPCRRWCPTVYWTGPVTFHSFLSSRIRKRISELSLQKKHMPICVNRDGYASPFHPFPFESKSRLKICCHPGDSQEFYARCYFAL